MRMSDLKLPLSEFADWHGEVNGIEINAAINLPEYAPAEGISVHLGRIATIARFGRLAGVQFRTFSGDSETASSATIGGINFDGSATAVGVKTASIVRTKHTLEALSESGERYPRSVARIGINTNHPDIQTARVRTPEPWTRLLNKGMKTGLVAASKDQLLKPEMERRTGFGVSKTLDIGFYTLLVTIMPDVNMSDSGYFLPAYLAGVATIDASGISRRLAQIRPYNSYSKEKYPEKSFFSHLPIDRHLAVRVLSKLALVST